MFNAFVDLKPMQTFQNGSDTSRERFLVVHKLTGNQSLWMTYLISAVILLSNVALTYFCFYRAMHMHSEDIAVAR